MSADENDLYQTLAGEGEHPPAALSDAAIDARVLRAGRHGIDPTPWLRKLRSRRCGCTAAATPSSHLASPCSACGRATAAGIETAVFPNANHALVETRTGLTAEMLRSDTFAPGLFARVGAWLRAHRL